VSERRLEPPSGDSPPDIAWVNDCLIDLKPLATEICQRYREEFPDEDDRYGPAGNAWCVHDNRYLLYWAAEAANGYLAINDEVAWLAKVLEARGFPLRRLARNLEIGAQVAREQVDAPNGSLLSKQFLRAAEYVRTRK
jgi:hypothetical protein